MKIWMSKRNPETGKKHVVLDMSRQEERESFWVLRQEVLGYVGRAPKRNLRSDGTVRYRFAQRHLDKLMLTFPFAEVSPGLDRTIRRANTVEQPEVPELDIPDFGLELYDFQKIGVHRMDVHCDTHKHRGFILNDELGLGKTVMGLAFIVKRLATPALVVCPNSAKWVWERAAQEHTELEVVVVDGTLPQRQAQIAQRADLTVINIEALRLHPELADFCYEVCITDEYHKFKNPKSQMTKAWHALQANLDILMSGTPMLSKPEDFWSGLHKLFPERYPSFWMFQKWLCIRTKGKYAKVVGYKAEPMGKLKKHIQDATVSLRRRKDQVLSDLPSVIYSTVLVDLTPEQRRLYNQIVREKELMLANGEITTVKGILSMVTRCKQACFSPELYGGSPHSAKLDELDEVVEQLVANGEKAIIFSQWSKATRIMQRRLAGYNPAYVDGSVKSKLRPEQQDKFNEDPDCHLFIGTIGANSTAITLGAATYVIFTDKDWVPLNNDQAIGRSAAGGLRGAHLGADVKVNVIELFARDTVEARIETLLARKRQMFNSMVERDGGPEIERITISEISELF